ncbi:hypothetical protein ACEPAG_8124 [Sanghuangporus baumii]
MSLPSEKARPTQQSRTFNQWHVPLFSSKDVYGVGRNPEPENSSTSLKVEERHMSTQAPNSPVATIQQPETGGEVVLDSPARPLEYFLSPMQLNRHQQRSPKEFLMFQTP